MREYAIASILAISLIVLTVSPAVGEEYLEAVVDVDFSQSLQRPSLGGFLHGIKEHEPPDDLVRPLKPKLFRMGRFSPALYDRVASMNARFQLVVSDGFEYGGKNGWPFDNYGRWEEYVRNLARKVGRRPILWDIWNEPDLSHFWGGSVAQYLETFRRAYNVLHSELGDKVKIVGPSLASFSRVRLKQFLDYSLDHGLKIDILSWHELTRWLIPKLPFNVDYARQAVFKSGAYEKISVQELQIGEYADDNDQFSPGELLAYLAAMEQAGIASAAKACWREGREGSERLFNCFPLDGIVGGDGLDRRAAWWLYRAYAALEENRLTVSSDDPRIVALAAPAGPGARAAQILIGFFEDRRTPDWARVTIRLRNHSANQCFKPVARLIPDRGPEPLQAPLPMSAPESLGDDTYRLSRIPLHAVAWVSLEPTPCR